MFVALALAASFAPPPSPQDALVLGPRADAPPLVMTSPGVGASGATPAIEALLTNVPGADRSWVPGLTGVAFEPGLGTRHFDRVYGHPSGRWALTGLADLASTEDECLIADGLLVIRESDPAPWTGGSEACGTIDQRCAINLHGHVAFATNSSASANDDYVVTYAGAQWSVAAREGDPIAALAGTTFDDLIDSPLLLDDGRVGLSADGIDGAVTTDEDDVLILGDVLLLQEGVSVPPGQVASVPAPIENFDVGDFWASSDGARWLVQGDLLGPVDADDVVVVDGDVVLQEGRVVPGSGFAETIATSGIFGASMDASGHWYARGENGATRDDWVVRDGAVVARTGAPVAPGSAEVWDDAGFSNGFVAHVGNGVGNWVVAGTTNHADPALDTVVVLDGGVVVVRESDPVDLDGNGMLDDDAYIDTFGDDDFALSDELELLAVVTLKDGGGARIGQALVRIELDPGVGTVHCDGRPNSTGRAARLMALGSASVAANDLRLRADRMPPNSTALFLVSRTPGLVTNPGTSEGWLCLGGAIDRFLGPGQFGSTGAAGSFELMVDLSSIPQPMGWVVGTPGDVWYFQCWFRDQGAVGAATSNFTEGVAVVLE